MLSKSFHRVSRAAPAPNLLWHQLFRRGRGAGGGGKGAIGGLGGLTYVHRGRSRGTATGEEEERRGSCSFLPSSRQPSGFCCGFACGWGGAVVGGDLGWGRYAGGNMPSWNSPGCTLTKKKKKNPHKLTTLLNGGMFSCWMRLHGRCERMMLWRTIKESQNFVKWAVYMQNGTKWIRPAVYMAAACNPLMRRHCATMGRYVQKKQQHKKEKCSDKRVVICCTCPWMTKIAFSQGLFIWIL